jgi:hypothetical protein
MEVGLALCVLEKMDFFFSDGRMRDDFCSLFRRVMDNQACIIKMIYPESDRNTPTFTQAQINARTQLHVTSVTAQ